MDEGLATYNEQYLYDIIASRHSILSKDAKVIGGYVKPKANGPDQWEPRKGFDTSVTKLQMQCYVLTSDFEYEIDKNGNFYGWGIARYATPEEFYGKYFTSRVYKRTPEESFRKIGEWIRGAKRYFLQKFTDRDTVPFEGFHAPSDEQMKLYRAVAREYIPGAELRGVEE